MIDEAWLVLEPEKVPCEAGVLVGESEGLAELLVL